MQLRAFPYGIMILGLAGAAEADALPPLRVDPALLNPALKVASPVPVPVPQLPVAPPTAAVTEAPQVVPVRVVPVAVKLPDPPAAKPETKMAPAVVAPVVVAPVAVTPVAVAPKAPPAAVAEAPAVAVHVPPEVAERPRLAPLYSAHVEAGVLRGVPAQPAAADASTTFISAQRIHGRNDVETVAEGDAELRKGTTVLTADQLTYQHLDDEVEAAGHVRLARDKDLFTGPKLRMRVGDNVGFFEQPTYSMTRMSRPSTPDTLSEAASAPRVPITGRGEAERIDFEGEGQYRLGKATYTTCPAGNNDWHAEVGELRLDYNREVAEGSDGKVVFQGVPILYSPWLSFSLDNQRKSGLLSPTFGSTSRSGGELMLPWYWNIAPNMDATIAPRVMTKRGTQWNVDARYLNHSFSGETHVDYLPDDRLEHKRRYGYAIQHRQQFAYGLAGTLNLNGVSDDTYFSDLSKPAAGLTQSNLLRQGQLSYGGGWWGASMMAQRYQILQDPSLPAAVEPYRRLPQINLFATRHDLPLGSAFDFTGEMVNFGHSTNVTGQRNTYYPQFSLPLQTAFLQVTPKLGFNVTRYRLSRQAAGTPSDMTRSLPIFSVDSSVVFERQTELQGRNLTQTLEPRLYYLYVPYRDQSQIPVFDTGLADFNFTQIFAENRYGGGDRIADANQITAAITSRLIDPATGAELVRGLIGQRYYFTTQHVSLPAVGTSPAEVPRTGRSADILAALSGQVMPKTYVDTGWQYNPRDARTERLNIGGRYQPEVGKVLNAGYRYTRDLLGQVDVSAQWPLSGGWHAVGRYNYSTKERRMIESVGGFEYDAGCWIGRVVVQRIATLAQQATTSLFFQLELNGFSRIGANPLEILKRNIPGYGLISQPVADPVLMPN